MRYLEKENIGYMVSGLNREVIILYYVYLKFLKCYLKIKNYWKNERKNGI